MQQSIMPELGLAPPLPMLMPRERIPHKLLTVPCEFPSVYMALWAAGYTCSVLRMPRAAATAGRGRAGACR